ncbi:MAG: VCBS repeat-containing protein, partial [Pirellula sp.]
MIFRNLSLTLNRILPLCCVCLTLCTVAQAQSGSNPKWSGEILPVELGVGYAVRAVDLSRDGKLDIAIVDSKRIVWLENPTWKVHTIYQTPSKYADNVCFAPLDID